MNVLNSQDGYQIFLKDELNNMIKDENIEFIDQINFNFAYLEYIERTKKFAVFPPTGKYAILFDSREVLDKMVKEEYFPVPLETDTFFEKDKKMIKDIEDNISIFLDEFFERLGDSSIPYDTDKTEDLIKINELVNNKIKKSKFDSRDEYLLGLFLNHYLKNFSKEELQWFLDPVYTLNIYWIPVLKKMNEPRQYAFWKQINESIQYDSKLDLIELMRWKVSEMKDIYVLSPEFADFLKNGRVGN